MGSFQYHIWNDCIINKAFSLQFKKKKLEQNYRLEVLKAYRHEYKSLDGLNGFLFNSTYNANQADSMNHLYTWIVSICNDLLINCHYRWN